ncbi:hypothetical protein C8R44DRAFT_732818 [Mycena epipterygia]|nr:hypothetical protein C8R44DRAFT_732818 [Mycena epipterygia]
MASKVDWSKKSDRRLYDAVEELCRPVLGIFVDADDVGREVALVGLVFEAKEIRQATDGRGATVGAFLNMSRDGRPAKATAAAPFPWASARAGAGTGAKPAFVPAAGPKRNGAAGAAIWAAAPKAKMWAKTRGEELARNRTQELVLLGRMAGVPINILRTFSADRRGFLAFSDFPFLLVRAEDIDVGLLAVGEEGQGAGRRWLKSPLVMFGRVKVEAADGPLRHGALHWSQWWLYEAKGGRLTVVAVAVGAYGASAAVWHLGHSAEEEVDRRRHSSRGKDGLSSLRGARPCAADLAARSS